MDNKKVICPFCKAIITENFDGEVGDILECSQCGTEIEIKNKEPLDYSELVEEK